MHNVNQIPGGIPGAILCQHAHSQATLGERESRGKSQERNPGEEGEIPGGIPGEISGSYPLIIPACTLSIKSRGESQGESHGAILL